jgi:hypothetical protein
MRTPQRNTQTKQKNDAQFVAEMEAFKEYLETKNHTNGIIRDDIKGKHLFDGEVFWLEAFNVGECMYGQYDDTYLRNITGEQLLAVLSNWILFTGNEYFSKATRGTVEYAAMTRQRLDYIRSVSNEFVPIYQRARVVIEEQARTGTWRNFIRGYSGLDNAVYTVHFDNIMRTELVNNLHSINTAENYQTFITQAKRDITIKKALIKVAEARLKMIADPGFGEEQIDSVSQLYSAVFNIPIH